MSRSITITVAFALALAVWPAAGWAAADGATPAKDGPPAVDPSQVVTSKTQVGQELVFGNHKAVVRAVDITPVVRNGYSERFKFDAYDNPKLRQLRDQEKLEDVVAEG
ncbi:MAG: hypothetical protein JXL80_16290, partial [Planctomycetes bacterium]|nr:hypothetical protein [Planctomycetota bacterium]